MHLAPHLPIPSRRPFDMRVPALVTQRAKKLQRFCYIHPPLQSLTHIQAQKDAHIHKVSTQEPRCTYVRANEHLGNYIQSFICCMHTPSKHHFLSKNMVILSFLHNPCIILLLSLSHAASLLLAHNCPITYGINLPKYSHSASCSHYELYIITSGRMVDPIWSMTSLYSKTFRDRDRVCTVCVCEKDTGGAVYCELKSQKLKTS